MASLPSLFPIFPIISMSSMAHFSLLDGAIVDQNIVSDITGIDLVTEKGFVGCPLPVPAWNKASVPAGLNVALTCDGGRTIIADALTDTEGFFKITFRTLRNSLLHPRQCDECRIVATGIFAGCGSFPGHRGDPLAPINCRDAVVERLHDDEQGHGNAVMYKAEPFYFLPSH